MRRDSLTPLLFEVDFFELFELEPAVFLDFVFAPVLLADELPFTVFVLVLVAVFCFPAPFYTSMKRGSTLTEPSIRWLTYIFT